MTWDDYFKTLVYDVAAKSQDRSSRYGAIIAEPVSHRLVATGYNGIPRGVRYREDFHTRPDKYLYFVHAEQNAIFNAAASGSAVDGCDIYLIQPPCIECAKACIQSGIRDIIYYEPHPVPDPNKVDLDNWRMTLQDAAALIAEAGLRMRRAFS